MVLHPLRFLLSHNIDKAAAPQDFIIFHYLVEVIVIQVYRRYILCARRDSLDMTLAFANMNWR